MTNFCDSNDADDVAAYHQELCRHIDGTTVLGYTFNLCDMMGTLQAYPNDRVEAFATPGFNADLDPTFDAGTMTAAQFVVNSTSPDGPDTIIDLRLPTRWTGDLERDAETWNAAVTFALASHNMQEYL